MLSGLLVWVFSTGFFFDELGFDPILELVGPLKQFRSLGRFAWVFYYIFSVVSVYYLYIVFRALFIGNKKKIAVIIAVAAFSWWGHEAIDHFQHISKSLFKQNKQLVRNERPFSKVLQSRGMQPDDFQAILHLPFLHLGCEKLHVERGLWAFRGALSCSYDTGLPIVNTMMSRTSVNQALSSLQLISSSRIRKTRLVDMDERSLLLFTELEHLRPFEKQITEQCTHIGKAGKFDLYKLPIKNFLPINPGSSTLRDSIYELLSEREIILLENAVAQPIVEGYDKESTNISFAGLGARYIAAGHPDTLLFRTFDLEQLTDSISISFWVFVDHLGGSFPGIKYERLNGDKTILKKTFHSDDARDVYGELGAC